MSKSMKIRLRIFLVLSFFICGALISQFRITEPAIKLTLCGGVSQNFDYFSGDFLYNQRQSYPGGNSLSTLTYKLNPEKMSMGHRFDFGGVPGETFLISSIILETPDSKFHRYVLDLDRAEEWIRTANQLKPVRILDHKLLIETAGDDGFLITKDNLFEQFARKELNISGDKFIYPAVIEILLLAFLLLFPWIAKGVIACGRVIFTRKFLIQSGIFVAVNLFMILPAFYFICRDLPDTLSITLKAKEPFILELFYKTPYSAKYAKQISYSNENQFQTLTFALPEDSEPNRIRLDLGSISQSIAVRSIAVIRHGLFRCSVNLKHAPEIYTQRNQVSVFNYKNGLLDIRTAGNDPYIIPDPDNYSSFETYSIQFGTIFRYIAGAEILLLLLLSQTLRSLILKISPVRLTNKENLLLSLSVAGAFSFIFTLSLPLQTFKMAEEIILFKMDLLVQFLCILAPAVFVVLAAILYFLNKRYGAFFTILLASITVLVVIECGFLSFNLPELNGEFDAYYNVPRMLLHIAVWLAGIVLPLCFQKKIYSWIPLALLVVSIMNGASLVDALMKKNPFEGRGKLIVKSTVNFDGTIDRVKYAAKNNVIMICLDAVTSEAVSEVFKEYPELKKSFPGFTLFTNNIGMNIGTMWAVPGFFTGKLISPEIPTVKYTSSMYSEESALKNYLDRKYALFFRVGLPQLSYLYPDQDSTKKITLLTPVEDSMLQWVFHELVLFKITPFFWKGSLMRYFFYSVWPARQNKFESDNSALTSANRDENYIYQKLADAPLLGPEFPGAFHYHHFHGAHPPFEYDRDGNRVKHSNIPLRSNWKGYYERTVFEMKRVSRYLQALMKRGLYDDSVIIILADHGMEPTLRKNDIPPRFRPFIMIKCRNSNSPLDYCDLPTSHTKISTFLKSDDIFSVRQADLPRIFYTKIRQVAVHRQQVFTIDENRKIISSKKLTGNNLMDKPVTLGFKYSLYNVSNGQFPPISYDNLVEQFNGLLLDNSLPASMLFKVSDKSASYRIVVDAVIGTGNQDVIVNVESNSGSKTIYRPGNSKIEIKSAKPDQEGIIHIGFKISGGSANLYLTGLTVGKE